MSLHEHKVKWISDSLETITFQTVRKISQSMTLWKIHGKAEQIMERFMKRPTFKNLSSTRFYASALPSYWIEFSTTKQHSFPQTGVTCVDCVAKLSTVQTVKFFSVVDTSTKTTRHVISETNKHSCYCHNSPFHSHISALQSLYLWCLMSRKTVLQRTLIYKTPDLKDKHLPWKK